MKFGSWLAATILAPVGVISAYVLLTRHFNIKATYWEYVGFGVSIISGLCCLWKLPTSVLNRIWLTIVFVPVGLALLAWYELLFANAVFGEWL